MEKLHFMPIPQLIRGLLCALGLSMLLTLSPAALATDVFDVSIGEDRGEQGDVSDEDCAELDESLAAAAGCDTSDKIIDFTKYEGGLEGPEGAGYDEALTQADNARDLIQTLVNFALSFLGLVATVMIIYGGVLYVTSRGDEDATSKGKKTISYAAIGIVIILSSFALVNTLIGATGGGQGTGVGGSGTDTISETGQAFDVGEVLDELELITEDFLEAYDSFIFVSQEVAFLKSLEIPVAIELTETDASLGGLFEGISESLGGTDEQDKFFQDTSTLIDEQAIDQYVDDLREGAVRIQQAVDPLSDTYQAAQALYDYLRSGSTAGLSSKDLLANLIPEASADHKGVPHKNQTCQIGSTYEGSVDEGFRGFSQGLGLNLYNTNVSAVDDQVCGLLDYIQKAADSDYNRTIGNEPSRGDQPSNSESLLGRLAALQELFDTKDQGGSELADVTAAFEEIATQLIAAKTSITANTTRNVIAAVNNAYELVQNIEFVNARINASVTRGNADLIVRFDALGSTDPSGDTIPDENYLWDLDGDGQYGETLASPGPGTSNCSETGTPAVDCTYTEPGTYAVKVKILSNEDNVAAGIARVNIIVDPPSSIIILDAVVSGATTTLADFSKFPAINQKNFKVTLAEATAGVTFDASKSTDGEGNALIFYEWDFGDGEVVSGETESVLQHLYGEQGRYQVSLTVTDSTGIRDRKTFDLFVASPAARIDVNPASGKIGTEFSFSGGGSTTDLGTIVSYQWAALRNAQAVTLEEDSGSNIDLSFDEPGVYSVSLTVTDSSNKQDSATIDVLVESQVPSAIFEYSIPDPSDPGAYFFDASDSFDPDPSDTLTYEWNFEGIEGFDYELLSEEEGGEKLNIRFLNTGSQDLSLTVCDQHLEELQKCDSASTELRVESVLDVELELDEGETVRLNDDGEAEVNFTARSNTATAFEIDYGDGEKEATDNITNNFANFSHNYERSGVFYVVLTALNDAGDENSTTRRVYVGAADQPIAVINILADNQDVGFGDTLTGNVNTKFTFDASNSVNTDGTTANLSYVWNFGDGTSASQKTVTHTFDEHITYNVTLTVKDKEDPTLSDETTVNIQIVGLDPEIKGISVTPVGDTLTTPLKVNVFVDASDVDGDINFVKGWYYDLNDSATALGTVISQTTSFSLTINTKGEEGDEVEYGFAAEVTDDDNRTVSSFDQLDADQIPTLSVVNGPNDTPVANFSVDKTSFVIGEPVTFSSTSYDPDGEIVEYVWDVEGDGFFNNLPQTSSNYTYNFTQIHPEGVQVSLKVTDSAGATATSDSLTLYIDAISEAPDAAFLADVAGREVTFHDNSKIDTENGAELSGLIWDFDTSVDSDGNGTSDDDVDSLEEDPVHTYPSFGTYSVKLTVVDNTGQTDTVTREILVQETAAPVAAFTFEIDDLIVDFENHSTTDLANDVTVREYVWDFDTDFDSDGDGDSDNDVDSQDKNPSHGYDSYGTYEVKLSVTDDFGKSDFVSQDLELESPIAAVTALLSSVPAANSNKQIVMSGTSGEITFFFSAEGGSGDYSFKIDKNIFFDTKGDGIRDNDIDFSSGTAGSWKTGFDKSWGQIVVKLTATDDQTGETDIETLQVVFPGTLAGTNLFNASPSEMIFLILSALLSATVGVILVFRYKPLSTK